MKLALVTYEDEGKYPGEGSREDSQLKGFLEAQGLDITFEIWTNLAVNWQQYQAVILKSPWDYFDKAAFFKAWLDKLDHLKVQVLNPTSVIRWNMNKEYLLEVEKAGFGIVPSILLPQGQPFKANSFFCTWNTNNIIVKPVISGGAKNTFSIRKTDSLASETQINQLLEKEDLLVQPFMSEIQTKGEWSLIFFNNKFSHSVLKVPRSGDFRVQHYFGGAIIPATPPAPILDYAQKILQQFAPGCLYARVDGLESDNGFKLMELELIEPMLFLLDKEELLQNYYQALQQIINF